MMVSTRISTLAVAAALLAACGGSQASGDPTSMPIDGTDLVTREMAPLTALESPPPPGDPAPYELPQVEEIELSNGLDVVLVRRPAFPTISVRLGVRAGMDASDGNLAVPELTIRLLRDGTTTRDSDAIARYIDGNGLGFSASAGDNSATLAADGLSTQLPELLTLLSDLTLNPTFAEDRFLARQEELAGEIQLAQAQQSYHLSRIADRAMFGDHIYGRTLTTEEVVAVDQAAVAAFHEATFGPDRARLVLVGALPEDAAAQIEAAFGAWEPTGNAWAPTDPPEPTFCNVAHVAFRPNSAQTAVTWLGDSLESSEAGYFDALVANEILGGGIIGRLFMSLREEKSYTYGAYSGMREVVGAAWFQASSNVRGEVTADAVGAFIEEFDRFQQETMPETDLQDNVSYLSGVFPIELARNGAVAGQLLSLYNRGLDAPAWLEGYRDAVTSVSIDSVTEAGRSLINPAALTLVMVGEEPFVRPAALQYASKVYVYDLDGELVETLDGEASSTCPE
ncbi:MAG: insulinase family protein [Myxococcales bacterium]|nr:insulinase family protein [Myxococcales bacterium]